MELMPFKKKNLSETVKEYLYNHIKNSDINGDTKLPPEGTIAQSLGVSRATIRSALTDLEGEGLVFRIHGKGTFINPRAVEMKVKMNTGNDLLQMIEDSGYNATSETTLVYEVKADPLLAKGLNIEENEIIVNIEKVFYADGNPAILCIDRVPLRYIEGYKIEEFKDSTFEVVRKYSGKLITWDDIEVTSKSIDDIREYTPSIDKMESTSLLVFETNNYNQENKVIFKDTEYYDTNYVKFNLIRQKNVNYKSS
ncbi:MAG: GntR family transcriptional regulator [Clostridium sp.]